MLLIKTENQLMFIQTVLISLGLLCNTPFVETYPLLGQLFDNGYKVLGHSGYPIPVITFHPQGAWITLDIYDIKLRGMKR